MSSSHETDFAALMPAVARLLFGEPNARLSSKRELRFGTHGSLAIDVQSGTFYDHEINAGGGVLDLIAREVGCDVSGAAAWLEHQNLKVASPFCQIDKGNGRPAAKRRVFYNYCDAHGKIAYRVERREVDGGKTFLQHGPDSKGGFSARSGGMAGVPLLPYRLDEWLPADPSRVIFVVEGEKDVDRLFSLGCLATTNSGGSKKFSKCIAKYFEGRRVVVIADNDDAGRDHVQDVTAKLHGVAKEVAILELAGLSPKGDVSDWLDAGGTVEVLNELAQAVLTDPVRGAVGLPAMLPLADLKLWSTVPATPKPFLMPGYIPANELTLITGAGGSNKSTFGQQLATCVAGGAQMLGLDVQHGGALYVTAEDDEDRLHWVQQHICSALGVSMSAVAGKLHLSSVRGRLGNEMAIFDNEGKLCPTPSFFALQETVRVLRPQLVVLDNAAHFFAGNENDRTQVTCFVNMLYSLAHDFGVTVVLVAHSNKAGGSYSGSTAWLNAVRSQIILTRPDNGADDDVRELTLGKANYARPGDKLTFRWHDFVLKLESEIAVKSKADWGATERASSDNSIFLACLAERTRQKRAVSEKRSPTYAPTEFAKMVESKSIGKNRLEAAMDRLFRINAIERANLWKGVDRKDVFGLRATMGKGAVNTICRTRETGSKCPENGAGNAHNTHTHTTYTAGAPLRGAASTGHNTRPNAPLATFPND